MKNKLLLGAINSILTLAIYAPWTLAQESPEDIEARLRADIVYLADDSREGRGIGTQGLVDAGQMIATRFRELGLKTELFAGQPYQDFTIPDGYQATVPSNPDQPAKNRLHFSGELSIDPKLNADWTPLALGSNGEFSGELVFAGYGISAPELEYDDYAGLDVKGKVVIVIRKQPRPSSSDDSKFGNPQNSRFAYFATKEANAAKHEAAAMILVNDGVTAGGSAGDRLFGVSDAGRGLGSQSIPTIQVLRETIDPVLQKATGKTLAELEKLIDDTQKPASQVLPGVIASGQADVTRNEAPVRNVLGLLPGSGSLAEEYVVVGAHYDHVGLGGEGSLAPGTREIHNGADDNASGTVSLLEIARQMSLDHTPNRRSILFIAFTAEERGLLGSKYYVQHPLIPIEKSVAMVNLDMVGRLDNGAVTVYGTGTAAEFPGWFDELGPLHDLKLEYQAAGYGPSDHQSFHEVGLPVIHLFTGMHGQYHRPSDDTELVDFKGMTKVALLATNLTYRLATRPEALTRQRNETRARITARRRGKLGITLDETTERVVISKIEDGSAAQKAGLHVGDTIRQVGDKKIETMEDLQSALENRRPKDEVVVKVLRGEQTLELKAELGQ